MAVIHFVACAVLFATSAYTANLDDKCTTHEQCAEGSALSYCMIPYVGCTEGTCTCKNGYIKHDHECIIISHIGDHCTEDQSASCDAGTHGSTCGHGGVCACPDEQKVKRVDGQDYCYKSGYGDTCEKADDCLTHIINNAYGVCQGHEANNGTCGCSPLTMPDPGDKEICRFATNGEDCSADDDGVRCAAGVGLDCNDEEKCACSTNYTWEDQACLHDKHTNVDEGQVCSVKKTDEHAKVCHPDLVCTKCSEDNAEDPYVCLHPTGGAPSQTITVTPVFVTAALTAYALFVKTYDF